MPWGGAAVPWFSVGVLLGGSTPARGPPPACAALMAPRKRPAAHQAEPREKTPPFKTHKADTTMLTQGAPSCSDADARGAPPLSAAPTSCGGVGPVKPLLLASCFDTNVNVLSLMRGIVAYVKFHLKVHMMHNPQCFGAFPDTELHEHPPLDIRAALSENDLLSYMATWSHDHVHTALTSTDMYEAGGNIFWINPFTSDSTEAIAPPGKR